MSHIKRKKLKLSIMAYIMDEVDSVDINLTNQIQKWQNILPPLLMTANTNFLTAAVVGFSFRQSHTRIPNFYEDWIDKYLNYDFFQLFRMRRESFYKLLSVVAHCQINFPQEPHTGGVEKVPLEKALLMTLWYFGKGDTIISISDRFNLASSTAHSNITKCLECIFQLLPTYIKWPSFEEQLDIAERFEELGGFPGAVGAVDGCHIAIKVPKSQHESYANRKFFHSVILQGICNVNKVLIDIFVGFPGSANDKRVLRNSSIFKKIEEKGSSSVFVTNEHHLLGDSGYFLTPWLMIPYENRGFLTRKQKNYNYVLSSTRVVIENVFGCLKNRWRILKAVDVYSIERAIKIIVACCVLHNFCIFNKDIYDKDLNENDDMTSRLVTCETGNKFAKEKREKICNSLAINKKSI